MSTPFPETNGWPYTTNDRTSDYNQIRRFPEWSQLLAQKLALVTEGPLVPGEPVADTGWVDLPLITVTAPTNERPQLRRIGNVVWLRGIVTATSTTLPPDSSVVIGTVPVGFRQPINVLFKATGQNGNTDAMVIISWTSGEVTLRTGSSQGSYYSLQFSWLVD